ncbi:Signal transduction histidine-protein kinase/phosphatase DegS [Burkholderia pseudomultivorans]|uniref:histidine kinase n=2 Tax=Burkholderia pseudomultivorans TaxID=1207504 RepID=A0A132ENX7_9BURK|nr:histidine kinase [Burkholderia pseudomultivorans]MDR8727945.1 Signal transduction histidine-protein kinase/phosphatase DegS [Burkholderia pseudomultivorans]MDR8734056.1 Signal transduction histidine-protein kinase/phosphatase DegS [Burkholderia pseudomultivorans]MDR8743718.1 Signal transduction histidine-protein kinase/phosphatase DegS [Burkholderia pseudomultivorans]MDR8757835.1 Signal transduction histidine-protein kinase/phosphatase DegS [Burkholderia pseudomultivorans]
MLRQPLAAGVVTLFVGAALSLGVALLVREQWQSAVHARFERRTARVTAMLRHELQSGVAVLESARGAFGLVPQMTSGQWDRYAETLDLDSSRSPVRQLGYAPLPAATRSALAGTTPLPAGPLAAATLSAPASAAPVVRFGASDAAPLARALQTGEVALGVHPADDDVSHDARTLTLFLPATASLHAASAASSAHDGGADGMLFAALSPRRLIERALDAERGLDLTMQADGDQRPIASAETTTDEASMSPDLMRRTEVLNFGGTALTLAYSADGRPSATGAQRAAGTVLGAGLLASFAFAALMYALVRGRLAAAADAGASSRGILNEARMMGIIRSSMEAIITIDEKQTVVIFNPMAEQVFGVSAMEAIGAPLSRFIPERFRAAHAKHVDQFGVTGVSERQMGRQRVLFGLRGNGEEFPIEASISQIRDASGKLYTVMLRDITERLRAENAVKQSREELRELSANLQKVREEEKTRIARELHDDLGQQLTALKMDLSVVEQQLRAPGRAQPDDAVLAHLQGMRRLIDATVASVRRIAADLRPVMLDDLGLVPAIEWLANDFTNRYGIDVERHIETGGITFTSTGATTLFRIVQEALTNVARHADATRVALRLDVEEGFCVLRVADNGRGAPPGGPAHEDKSFGLIGIRERAHMLGGSVTIDTALARGFSITVAFPLSTVQQETLIT